MRSIIFLILWPNKLSIYIAVFIIINFHFNSAASQRSEFNIGFSHANVNPSGFEFTGSGCIIIPYSINYLDSNGYVRIDKLNGKNEVVQSGTYSAPGCTVVAHGILKYRNSWLLPVSIENNNDGNIDCGYMIVDSCLQFKKFVRFLNPSIYDQYSFNSGDITHEGEIILYPDNSYLDTARFYTYSTIVKLDSLLQVSYSIGTGNIFSFVNEFADNEFIGCGYNLTDSSGGNYSYRLLSNILEYSIDRDNLLKLDHSAVDKIDVSLCGRPYWFSGDSALVPISVYPVNDNNDGNPLLAIQKVVHNRWADHWQLIKKDSLHTWNADAIYKINEYYVLLAYYIEDFKTRLFLILLNSDLEIMLEKEITPSIFSSNRPFHYMATDTSIYVGYMNVFNADSSGIRVIQYSIPDCTRIDLDSQIMGKDCDTGLFEMNINRIDSILLGTKYFNTSYYNSIHDFEAENKYLNLYPNPASDIVKIPEKLVGYKYFVYSTDGRKLLSGNCLDYIDLDGLNSGMYIVLLFNPRNPDMRYYSRIVKTDKGNE